MTQLVNQSTPYVNISACPIRDGAVCVEINKFRLSVTREGHVYTYDRIVENKFGRLGFSQTKHAKSLSFERLTSGYLSIRVKSEQKRKRFLAHRIIGMAFVPGYSDELTINHINGIKTDNRIENLEWVTLAKNSSLQWQTGLVDLRGEKQPGSKLKSHEVLDIVAQRRMGASIQGIADMYNVSTAIIYLIVNGKRWAHLTAIKASPSSDGIIA